MPETIIDVLNLSKTYKGGKQAVKNASFRVFKGEYFAFLGPNGAGKSTTIKILTTLMQPDSGQVAIAHCDLGRQAGEIRGKIGVALQTTAIDPMLTGREILELHGRLFRLSAAQARSRAVELLELVNLISDADIPCGKYSGGMQRRLDMALALVHRPEILFLDEPTSGLDPVNRIELWNEIRKLNRQYGTTIFLTTQYLYEADQVADRVCIINDGAIVATEEPEILKRSLALDKITVSFNTDREYEHAKVLLAGSLRGNEPESRQLDLYVENGRDSLPEILRNITDAQLYPNHIAVFSPTLDDVFMHLTRKETASQQRRENVC